MTGMGTMSYKTCYPKPDRGRQSCRLWRMLGLMLEHMLKLMMECKLVRARERRLEHKLEHMLNKS